MRVTERFESGIPYEHILNYLKHELALAQTGAGIFEYGNMLVELKQKPPRRLGSASLPCTQIALSGCADDVEGFKQAFIMRFLSSGG